LSPKEPNAPAALLPRLELRRAEESKEDQLSDRLGSVRLVLALVALVLVLLPLGVRASWPWWSLVPLALVFLVLGVWHDRVERRLHRARAARRYLEDELARVEERWRSLPDDGADLAPSDARAGLAGDLDLFGPASLYQLTTRAVTPHGRRALARWLLDPAGRELVLARQESVRELAAHIEWREGLQIAARAESEEPLREARLLAWAESPRPLPLGLLLRAAAVVEPVLTAATLVIWLAGGPAAPLAIAALIQVGTLLAVRRPVAERAEVLAAPDRALARYADLIEVIESLPAASAGLKAVQGRLRTEGRPAHQQIRGLHALVERLEWSANMFFALTVGPALLWDLQVVLRAEAWQRACGPRLRGWLEAIGDAEALASLAGMAAERPDYTLPELRPNEEGTYRAVALAHPMIDRRRVVANDLELGGPGSVLLLSGSNMSGKSTLLRAVGLSVVMARAGGPVAASSLALSPFELSTSIRVVDSLARGASHFYAELTRIKETLDRAAVQGGALMYLLDEMLHGTNSKERYIGAISVIRWLSANRAVGVVTTHDLALAKVADQLPAGTVVNRHFGDEVLGSELRFDYKLREGPVQSTNALRLMRAIGIDIELSAPE
jgi:hypothetical protein